MFIEVMNSPSCLITQINLVVFSFLIAWLYRGTVLKRDNEISRTDALRKQEKLKRRAVLNLLKAHVVCLDQKIAAMQSSR